MYNEARHHRASFADAADLRQRARDVIDEAISSPDYQADHENVRRILNMALATELVSVLSFNRHFSDRTSPAAGPSAAGLREGASSGSLTAGGPPSTRISHRGGTLSRSPNGTLAQSCTEYF